MILHHRWENDTAYIEGTGDVLDGSNTGVLRMLNACQPGDLIKDR